MAFPSFVKHRIARRTTPPISRWIAAGLVFYFLAFSSFAVFHAYANDELAGTDCAIGHWLQQGQADVGAAVLPSFVLFSFSGPAQTLETLHLDRMPSVLNDRSPPSEFSL